MFLNSSIVGITSWCDPTGNGGTELGGVTREQPIHDGIYILLLLSLGYFLITGYKRRRLSQE